MTVADQQTVFSHTGNGVTTSFAYGCQVLLSEDMQVSIDGVVQTSGYTVNGIGSDSGGSVVFDAAPADGSSVVLVRSLPLKRETDFQQRGDWKAAEVNPDFDRLWMVAQQQQEQIDRSLRFPVADTALGAELPSVADRANKLMSFNSNGDPIAAAPESGSATDLALQLASSSGAGQVGFDPGVTGPSGGTVQQALENCLPIAGGKKVVLLGGDDAHQTEIKPGNPTDDRTVTLPDATTTLVGTDATQTLTNKTISGDDNTITDIAADSLDGGQTGAAPIFAARAWVLFNGSDGSIYASGNVSGVTKNTTGSYTIAFATAMPDEKYAVIGTCSNDSAVMNVPGNVTVNTGQSGSSCTVLVRDSSAGSVDRSLVSVVVYR